MSVELDRLVREVHMPNPKIARDLVRCALGLDVSGPSGGGELVFVPRSPGRDVVVLSPVQVRGLAMALEYLSVLAAQTKQQSGEW